MKQMNQQLTQTNAKLDQMNARLTQVAARGSEGGGENGLSPQMNTDERGFRLGGTAGTDR